MRLSTEIRSHTFTTTAGPPSSSPTDRPKKLSEAMGTGKTFTPACSSRPQMSWMGSVGFSPNFFRQSPAASAGRSPEHCSLTALRLNGIYLFRLFSRKLKSSSQLATSARTFSRFCIRFAERNRTVRNSRTGWKRSLEAKEPDLVTSMQQCNSRDIYKMRYKRKCSNGKDSGESSVYFFSVAYF
jgi:hypothetical protein